MLAIVGVLGVVWLWSEATMTPEQRTARTTAQAQAKRDSAAAGKASREALVCPHCQTAGQVTSRAVTVKKGISGGKATGALLTGGLSLGLTGLSRKEGVTERHCGKCRSTWHVA